MNRGDIRAHVRPQLEALLDEIVERTWAQLADSVDEVIGVARSVLASEAAPLSVRADDCDDGAVPPGASPPSSIPQRAAAPRPETRSPARVSGGATGPRCGKCGEGGHNARSCGRVPKGRPHDAAHRDRIALRPSTTIVAPLTAIAPAPRDARYSAIEIAAAKRKIAERAATPVATKTARAARPVAATVPIVAELPIPTYSCEFDTSRGRDPMSSIGDE